MIYHDIIACLEIPKAHGKTGVFLILVMIVGTCAEDESRKLASCLKFCLLLNNMAVTKRIRIYTEEDVANHKSANSCWVTYRGKVYDVTAFMPDHPGGDDLIMDHAGTDVESIMKDGDSHDHSDSAYDMLEEYMIGRLGTEATVVSDGVYLSFALPENTFI